MHDKTIKRILGLLRPYMLHVAISIMLSVIIVVATFYLPVLSGKAVDLMIGKARVDVDAISSVLATMGICIGLTAVSQWLMTVTTNHIAYHIVRDMRVAAFSRIQKLPLSYLDSHSHGDLISRIINDIEQFSQGLLLGFAQLFTGLLTIVITLVFMFMLDYRIAFVVVLLTPISILVAGSIARNTYKYFRAQSEKRGVLTSIVEESMYGLGCIETFGVQNKVYEKFAQADEELRKMSMNATFFSSTVNPSTRCVNSLIYASVGILGAISTLSGRITVGQLSAFLSYATQYNKPFNEISGVVTELQNSIACARRVFELIDESAEPDIVDAHLSDVSGHVQLKDVSFSYTDDKPLIEQLSLDIKPGMRVAIVGPTGCGKTTLINLLMRFYDVNAGSICVEGNDIRDVSRHSLREAYGMVLQDTWLKRASIRENICMGYEDATDEEVLRAAKESYAYSFIRRLPDGFDTVIKSDGNLSAGQKQLLCIARIMLRIPPILILDEATSALDNESEILVGKSLELLAHGRTTLTIAHRLTTIKDYDRILVLGEEGIVEEGSHSELLERQGVYYRLWNQIG